MRFHVVGLPHTQTTKAYLACAYTQKVRGFCRMMRERGHAVFLYAGEENDAPCDEHVVCISEAARAAAVGLAHYTQAPFDAGMPHWRDFNNRAIAAIRARMRPDDFLCLIAGDHEPIADAVPELVCVEFGIGYGRTFARFRVWESYAWMHTVYGQQQGAVAANGHAQDAVIPGWFDPDDFPFEAEKSTYFLFVGRLIPRKGYMIAVEACRRLGARVVLAGPGKPPPDCTHVGVVDARQRGLLMSRAKALFVPTIYVEPFGTVAIEAMACGTPVITSDWGAFTETVTHGVTGFRCRTVEQFVEAAERVGELDPRTIHETAMRTWSMAVIAPRYEEYFERVAAMHAGGATPLSYATARMHP